ncbi:hypothetical protein [Pseudomonas sp. FIP_A4]|uniref:hypothetical protein n=1 Tax=Pseudomonas sp. FIP_A4 TaxID=3070684 RepID=UPI001115AB53
MPTSPRCWPSWRGRSGARQLSDRGPRYQRAECCEHARHTGVTKLQTPDKRRYGMLKFIGGTAGIIFIIGLIVVIGLFKLVF